VIVFATLEITEQLLASLINSGPFGAIVLWFMWRDGKKLDTMTEALNHLIQMAQIEVMTRPNLQERIKDEVEELMTALEERRKGK
jgi:hypothetical protein